MLNYTAIGKKIRQLRKAQGLSQEQLAEQIWISVTHMSHIETGTTKLSLPVLVDIANALSVGTDEILETSLSGMKERSAGSIQALLDTCTPKQAQVLEAILRSAKTAMDSCL